MGLDATKISNFHVFRFERRFTNHNEYKSGNGSELEKRMQIRAHSRVQLVNRRNTSSP